MANNINKQISSEHQCLLNYCDLIENCLKEIIYNHSDNYHNLNNFVHDLSELFNIHLPKDMLLINRTISTHDNQILASLLINIQYPALIKDLEILNKSLTAAVNGHYKNNEYINAIAHGTIQQIRLTISLEDELCFPYTHNT